MASFDYIMVEAGSAGCVLAERLTANGKHKVLLIEEWHAKENFLSRMRLRGVANLRVCDCSVFPEMIAGNTNALTMAMAARAADLIVEEARVLA